MTKNLRPMDAKGDQILSLNRDNFAVPGFWILHDGYDVTVCAQMVGDSRSASVTIPRVQFNKLVRWYMREQKIAQRKKP